MNVPEGLTRNLLRAYKRGQKEAKDELVLLVQPSLQECAKRCLGYHHADLEAVGSVVSDINMAILVGLRKLPDEPIQAVYFLSKVCQYKTYDLLKEYQRQSKTEISISEYGGDDQYRCGDPLPASDSTPEDQVLHEANLEEEHALFLQTFTEAERGLLVRYIGLEHGDREYLARELGMSYGALRARICALKKRAHSAWRKYYEK